MLPPARLLAAAICLALLAAPPARANQQIRIIHVDNFCNLGMGNDPQISNNAASACYAQAKLGGRAVPGNYLLPPEDVGTYCHCGKVIALATWIGVSEKAVKKIGNAREMEAALPNFAKVAKLYGMLASDALCGDTGLPPALQTKSREDYVKMTINLLAQISIKKPNPGFQQKAAMTMSSIETGATAECAEKVAAEGASIHGDLVREGVAGSRQ